MEDADRKRLIELAKQDLRISRLLRRHSELDTKIQEITKGPFRTPEEQIEERRLKLEKLRGVDEMMAALAAA